MQREKKGEQGVPRNKCLLAKGFNICAFSPYKMCFCLYYMEAFRNLFFNLYYKLIPLVIGFEKHFIRILINVFKNCSLERALSNINFKNKVDAVTSLRFEMYNGAGWIYSTGFNCCICTISVCFLIKRTNCCYRPVVTITLFCKQNKKIFIRPKRKFIAVERNQRI